MKYEKKDLKFLDVSFNLKQFEDEDPEYFYFEGYGSTFGNIDRGNDVVMKGAFQESLKEQMPALFWQHKATEPLGIFVKAYEDNHGLYVKGKMPKADTFVSGRVIPQMKIGAINKMSIGFTTEDFEKESYKGEVIYKLTKIKLWEVSLVSIPMNDKADVTHMKSIVPYQNLQIVKTENNEPDTTMTWNSDAAIKRIREFTGSTEKPSESYREAFLWYDKENIESFGSYKMPIADVIDNRLQVIPRAIYAAAAAMRGARGGVDIPEEERAGVIENIEKYYKKMEQDSPFEKGFSRYIEKMSKMSEVCEFLRASGHSNKETNSIVSIVKRIARDERSFRDEKEALCNLQRELVELTKIFKGE
jgi:HK97 family phage prohead protease